MYDYNFVDCFNGCQSTTKRYKSEDASSYLSYIPPFSFSLRPLTRDECLFTEDEERWIYDQINNYSVAKNPRKCFEGFSK